MPTPDYSKSLGELIDLPRDASGSRPAVLPPRWLILTRTPLEELSVEGIRDLLGVGLGVPVLVPLAIDRLEHDPSLVALLWSVLNVAAFPWLDEPAQVRRVRCVVQSAFSDLNEWDGTAEIVEEANRHRRDVMEAWAYFERRLSKVE